MHYWLRGMDVPG